VIPNSQTPIDIVTIDTGTLSFTGRVSPDGSRLYVIDNDVGTLTVIELVVPEAP
jgi:hypothetical protein